MGDSLQVILNTNSVQQLQYQQPAMSEIDNLNLLPTDDQLDQLVDSLCENFPSLKLKLDFDQSTSSSISSGNPDITNVQEPIINEPVHNDTHVNRNTFCNSPKKHLLIEKTTHAAKNSGCLVAEISPPGCQLMKHFTEKRFSSNCNLNAAIMQCTSSLEQLVDKRKSLELLVQVQHNVTNINYNFSYTPRLPDTPTRVDRLIYDVSQERCRVLGLMSILEKTMNSFTSQSTKDDMRQLLIAYGKAIVDVIKERQSEINYSNSGANCETRVSKLVQLIDEVKRYTRRVNTALWCIEVKEQVNMVVSQKRCHSQPKRTNVEPPKNPVVGMSPFQKSWHLTRSTQPKSQKTPSAPKILKPFNGFNGGLQPKKGRQYPVCMGMVQHQQTSIYQVIPSSPKDRNASAMQLYAQQQRAEIFQRYSSNSSKNNRNSGPNNRNSGRK